MTRVHRGEGAPVAPRNALLVEQVDRDVDYIRAWCRRNGEIYRLGHDYRRGGWWLQLTHAATSLLTENVTTAPPSPSHRTTGTPACMPRLSRNDTRTRTIRAQDGHGAISRDGAERGAGSTG